MSAPAVHADVIRLEAAAIAFALIRFEQGAAHPYRPSTPPGQPRIGIDAYVFTPSWRKVLAADVTTFLASLPSPALMSPTTTRGIVALTLVNELSGDRRRWAEKTLSNATDGFEELSQQLNLSPQSRILLEFDEEAHVFSYAATRLWTEQFAVQVGWNMARLENDQRADARLQLIRSDGVTTWGDNCAVAPQHPNDLPSK